MQRLWGYLYQHRYRYMWCIVCLVVLAALALVIPWLLKQAVEEIEQGRPVREVASTALMIIGAALVVGMLYILSRLLIFDVGRDIEYQLRNDLLTHLQTLSLNYYQSQSTGDLMSRLVNDVEAVRSMLSLGTLYLLRMPLYYVLGLAAMLAIDPVLALLVIAPCPLVFLLICVISGPLMRRTLNVQVALAALSSRVQESVSGMAVIRAYGRETWQNALFAGPNDAYKTENIALARLQSLFLPLTRMASGIGLLAVLWYGGSQVIAGQLGLGDVVASIGYLHLLAGSTASLGLVPLFSAQQGRPATAGGDLANAPRHR